MAWNVEGFRSGAAAAGCAILAAAAIAGCGGGSADDGAARAEAVAPPATGATPEQLTTQLGSVLATARKQKDCKPIAQTISRSLFKFACPAPKEGKAAMRKLKVLDAGVYGAGAVVDYTTGGDKPTAIVLLLNHNREWIVARYGLVAERSVGSSDEDSRAAYDTAVADYLRAVRTRNCDLFIKRAATSSAKRKLVCKGEFQRTKQLAKVLEDNPRLKPRYYGGNAGFGFYRLSLPKPATQSLTLSVFKQPSGYIVLNVIPGPGRRSTPAQPPATTQPLAPAQPPTPTI